MAGKTIEQLRGEAAVLMAEIRPLSERLTKLKLQHANLQQEILDISRREAAVRKIAPGVSGKQQPRRDLNISEDIVNQFAALPAALKASLLAELRKGV